MIEPDSLARLVDRYGIERVMDASERVMGYPAGWITDDLEVFELSRALLLRE